MCLSIASSPTTVMYIYIIHSMANVLNYVSIYFLLQLLQYCWVKVLVILM